MTTLTINNPGDYEPIALALKAAFNRAANGKGRERHGHGRSFYDQPLVTITRTHGLGFAIGQAAKKIDEQATMSDPLARANELLDAVVYLAFAASAIVGGENSLVANIDDVTGDVFFCNISDVERVGDWIIRTGPDRYNHCKIENGVIDSINVDGFGGPMFFQERPSWMSDGAYDIGTISSTGLIQSERVPDLSTVNFGKVVAVRKVA